MEKHFAARLFAVLTASFAVTFLSAQDQNTVAANRLKFANANAIAALVGQPLSTPANAVVYVRAKVMRSFLQSFPDATDVSWSAGEGQYLVDFTQEGKLCKAVFRNGGALMFSLSYGTEKDLPREVRKLVKTNYFDYTIDMVTEVNTSDLKAWIVNLTDSNHLVVASVHEGTLEELHNYKKHF